MKIAFPDDFSDRLSPMLVKELRQGLRTKAFIGVFLTLQIVLGIIILGAGTSSSSDEAGSTISSIIFIIFSFTVIIIQPLRGMGGLSSEIKGNTIDMMVLTRLSAWRIVSGKWSAIVSQSTLLLITIIPYLILRYFFGGMNVVSEIILILLTFITSAALTAITIGLSASVSIILRAMLPMIAIPTGYFSFMEEFYNSYNRSSLTNLCSLETQSSQIAICLYIITCLYYGYLMLSIGTTLIAPYAENYSTLRRLIALATTILAISIGCIYLKEAGELLLVLAVIFIPIFTITLTEYNILVPPVVNKFHRYGALGKLFGLFLLPGWATGVFFCYLLVLISSFAFFYIPSTYGMLFKFNVLALGMLGGLIFPALLVNFFKMHGPARVSNYILICVATGVITATLFASSQALSNSGFLWFFIWIPPVSIVMTFTSHLNQDAVLISSVIVNLIYCLIFMIMAFRNYRHSINTLNHSSSEI